MSEQPNKAKTLLDTKERAKAKEMGPTFPAPWELHEAHAIQALAAGKASEEQQRAAFRWIVEEVCGTYDLSYRRGPDGDRDTVFAEGKRFVGQQVVKLTKINLQLLRKKESNG